MITLLDLIVDKALPLLQGCTFAIAGLLLARRGLMGHQQRRRLAHLLVLTVLPGAVFHWTSENVTRETLPAAGLGVSNVLVSAVVATTCSWLATWLLQLPAQALQLLLLCTMAGTVGLPGRGVVELLCPHGVASALLSKCQACTVASNAAATATAVVLLLAAGAAWLPALPGAKLPVAAKHASAAATAPPCMAVVVHPSADDGSVKGEFECASLALPSCRGQALKPVAGDDTLAMLVAVKAKIEGLVPGEQLVEPEAEPPCMRTTPPATLKAAHDGDFVNETPLPRCDSLQNLMDAAIDSTVDEFLGLPYDPAPSGSDASACSSRQASAQAPCLEAKLADMAAWSWTAAADSPAVPLLAADRHAAAACSGGAAQSYYHAAAVCSGGTAQLVESPFLSVPYIPPLPAAAAAPAGATSSGTQSLSWRHGAPAGVMGPGRPRAVHTKPPKFVARSRRAAREWCYGDERCEGRAGCCSLGDVQMALRRAVVFTLLAAVAGTLAGCSVLPHQLPAGVHSPAVLLRAITKAAAWLFAPGCTLLLGSCWGRFGFHAGGRVTARLLVALATVRLVCLPQAGYLTVAAANTLGVVASAGPAPPLSYCLLDQYSTPSCLLLVAMACLAGRWEGRAAQLLLWQALVLGCLGPLYAQAAAHASLSWAQ